MKYPFILLFFVTNAHAETINYCMMGRYDKSLDRDFRISFSKGWDLFQALTNHHDPEPYLEYSTKISDVRIIIYPDNPSSSGAAADVTLHAPGKEIMRIFYKGLFAYYAPERKAQVIAHELCHFYYRLLDEYEYGENRMSTTKHNCVMGNFMLWGWHGRFCSDCQPKVDAYYKRQQ